MDDVQKRMNRTFWKDRHVLLTGHTGFKGAWTAAVLSQFGAKVCGFALAPDQHPALWDLIGSSLSVSSHIGNVLDVAALDKAIDEVAPQIVIHMAAQALVRRSYKEPVETFNANVIGTANLLEALRRCKNLEAVLVVTSDKVYRNKDDGTACCEDNALGGDDPYSASKAACELLVQSYRESFFDRSKVALASARAGNVLGGGDFSGDRLVPDLYRALITKQRLVLRNPNALRPWQHVLDCVCGYLTFVEHLYSKSPGLPVALNFGPFDQSGMTVSEVVDAMARALHTDLLREVVADDSMPEKNVLALDSSKARQLLGWVSQLSQEQTIEWTASWYAAFARGEDPSRLVHSQIENYLKLLA